MRVGRLNDKVKMPNVSQDFVQDLSIQNVASTPENYNLAFMGILTRESTYNHRRMRIFGESRGHDWSTQGPAPLKLTNHHPVSHRK